MSVTVRPYRRGGWEVDIQCPLARRVAPAGSGQGARRRRKSAALRWGEARERMLLRTTCPQTSTTKEVPTLQEFAPRFLDGYARANRQKPSGIAAKETILRVHLCRCLGRRRLDAITNEDVQRLKRALGRRRRRPSTTC